MQWLWKEWANVLRLRNVGIPTVGFTWYSLTDQVDWDTALREQNGNVNPLGLYDLDRNIRNVGKAYKQLIARLARRASGVERVPGRADRAAVAVEHADAASSRREAAGAWQRQVDIERANPEPSA